MLPYRFALIVSPFSNKHLKIPLGNYWGSPWELFPAGLIGGTPGARHLPWIDPRCTGHLDSHSQKRLQRNKLTRGMGTALWPQWKAAMGDRVFQLDWEMEYVWFCERWSVKTKHLPKASRASPSTQFYSECHTQMLGILSLFPIDHFTIWMVKSPLLQARTEEFISGIFYSLFIEEL